MVINPYDPCMVNMTTKGGKKLTVIWNVDDLMVSCEEYFKIPKLACYLCDICGPKMTIHLGNKHDYLGVVYEFKDKKVEVSMFDYVDKTMEEFPEDENKRAATPASNHPFEVHADNEAIYLLEEQTMAFHHTVTQLLFLATRARRDIGVAVSFLTSCVKKPDEDNWGKVKQVLSYLWGTRRLKLTFDITLLRIAK